MTFVFVFFLFYQSMYIDLFLLFSLSFCIHLSSFLSPLFFFSLFLSPPLFLSSLYLFLYPPLVIVLPPPIFLCVYPPPIFCLSSLFLFPLHFICLSPIFSTCLFPNFCLGSECHFPKLGNSLVFVPAEIELDVKKFKIFKKTMFFYFFFFFFNTFGNKCFHLYILYLTIFKITLGFVWVQILYSDHRELGYK